MKDTSSKISTNRLKKEAIVAGLLQKVEKAKGIIFTDYQGLTHQQIEALKKSLKAMEAEYVNTKNTLLLIALKKTFDTPDTLPAGRQAFDTLDTSLNRPTATLFMYNDIVGPLKAITKSIKEFQLPSIKFGILEGKIIAEDDIVKISTLPPLDVLRAQLLGNMMSPISGLRRALSWNINKLVLTLKAIETKKV